MFEYVILLCYFRESCILLCSYTEQLQVCKQRSQICEKLFKEFFVLNTLTICLMKSDIGYVAYFPLGTFPTIPRTNPKWKRGWTTPSTKTRSEEQTSTAQRPRHECTSGLTLPFGLAKHLLLPFISLFHFIWSTSTWHCATSSCQKTKVKQHRVRLVLGWVSVLGLNSSGIESWCRWPTKPFVA